MGIELSELTLGMLVLGVRHGPCCNGVDSESGFSDGQEKKRVILGKYVC